MSADLQTALAIAIKERDGWMQSAASAHQNATFYKTLLEGCGIIFGAEARTADDGTVGDSVLALKVPDLVMRAVMERDELRQFVVDARIIAARHGMIDPEVPNVDPAA